MERNLLAVYDPDPEFVFRFMEYANLHASVPLDVQAFTAEESLRRANEKTPPEVLLISSKVMKEELKNLSFGALAVLLEERQEDSGELPGIYKYQPPEELLRQVLSLGGRKQLPSPGEPGKRKMEKIGVYSPVGRTRKTSFALTMGQILARNHAVLYLNLETFAGFEQLLSERYDRTLSDLLFLAGQKEADLKDKLPGIVRNLQNLDYVPPVLSPEDLQSAGPEEWINLFRKLEEQTGYDVLLLDFGEAVQDLPHLLSECDRIYLPVRKDPMARAKLEQFSLFLENRTGRETAERIRKVSLPFCQSGKQGPEYFADLVWSELGDYIRQLLTEEGSG